MVTSFSDGRPPPVLVALGVAVAVTLLGGLVLVFQRLGGSDLPKASGVGSGKIVFASDRKDDLDIYSMNADGSAQVRLTDSRSVDSFPAWSPDGKWIAFVSDRENEGEFKLYKMRADGSNVTKILDITLGTERGGIDWGPRP